MGRRKIEIQPITHDRNRSVTFLKRKNGLFKKAYELGVLCSVDVCVIVFAHNGKLHEYCSGDSSGVLERRLKYSGERDLRRPADYKGGKGAGAGGKGGAGAGDSDLEDEGDSPTEDIQPGASIVQIHQMSAASPPKQAPPFDFADEAGPPSSNHVNGSDSDQFASFLSSTSNIRDSLPPSSHPLNISALSNPSYPSDSLSSRNGHSNNSRDSSTSNLSNSREAAAAQYHHQLAQTFLVNQLQNINPNLNLNLHRPSSAADNTPPRHHQMATGQGQGGPLPPVNGALSISNLNFAVPNGVPPRGGAVSSLQSLPFGIGLSGSGSGGSGGNASSPSTSAYSNAFLNSLLGSAGGGNGGSGGGGGIVFPNAPTQQQHQQQHHSSSHHMPPPAGVPWSSSPPLDSRGGGGPSRLGSLVPTSNLHPESASRQTTSSSGGSTSSRRTVSPMPPQPPQHRSRSATDSHDGVIPAINSATAASDTSVWLDLLAPFTSSGGGVSTASAAANSPPMQRQSSTTGSLAGGSPPIPTLSQLPPAPGRTRTPGEIDPAALSLFGWGQSNPNNGAGADVPRSSATPQPHRQLSTLSESHRSRTPLDGVPIDPSSPAASNSNSAPTSASASVPGSANPHKRPRPMNSRAGRTNSSASASSQSPTGVTPVTADVVKEEEGMGMMDIDGDSGGGGDGEDEDGGEDELESNGSGKRLKTS
ncbi:hypothetical protein FRB94_011040 [Tulasnella sp. JGI-2019a]|nr:hypothetical protein FRB93_002176 [Tulasnella sp. JGI-2019a]KAG8993127.1 hypothetical protein FRB94_011040 [Tulasnella sp. JGI-2019a]